MAAVLLSNNMAQNHNSNENDDVKPAIFHDFLGSECAPVPNCAATGDSSAGGSPSASASRAGGPISSTSDLGSDRQVVSHLEGVPFYGGNINRYVGSKRSNSDSMFFSSSRDGVPQMRPDFPDSSHLIKMLRSVGHEHPLRPTSSSLIIQPHTNAKSDSNPSKWERAIPVNVGPVLQLPPRVGQPVPYQYQPLSNRFKDVTMGNSVISQSAADEGSRTGIKISVPEPGSSTPVRRQGSTSESRQMTIFYGGQAHVFDDVHPNKADAIMAMAGSSGGSWSTSYSQKSTIKASGGHTVMGIGSDRMPLMHGRHSGVVMTDVRRPTRDATELSTQEKP